MHYTMIELGNERIAIGRVGQVLGRPSVGLRTDAESNNLKPATNPTGSNFTQILTSS